MDTMIGTLISARIMPPLSRFTPTGAPVVFNAGQFDENPYFDADRDPLPKPRLLREYLRSQKTFAPQTGASVARTGRNAIDEMLARHFLDEARSVALGE